MPDADSRVSASVTRLQGSAVANARPRLVILSAAVGLVLLIACVNVAGPLFARELARRKEIAIRTALSAPAASLPRPAGQTFFVKMLV